MIDNIIFLFTTGQFCLLKICLQIIWLSYCVFIRLDSYKNLVVSILWVLLPFGVRKGFWSSVCHSLMREPPKPSDETDIKVKLSFLFGWLGLWMQNSCMLFLFSYSCFFVGLDMKFLCSILGWCEHFHAYYNWIALLT